MGTQAPPGVVPGSSDLSEVRLGRPSSSNGVYSRIISTQVEPFRHSQDGTCARKERLVVFLLQRPSVSVSSINAL